MTQQQTERDDALIAEAERRAAIDRNRDKSDPRLYTSRDTHLIRLVRENWTPPAKPDRYEPIAEEFLTAWYGGPINVARNREQLQAAAAVLRRHFAPPSEVVEAARCLRDGSPKGGSAELCADFILKGDQ